MRIRQGTCVGGLLCALLGAGCNKAQSYEKPLTPVKVQTVERQLPAGGEARYSAIIQPNAQVALAFRIGGYVDELLQTGGRSVRPGDWIAKGSMLARIRDADFSARIRQARAELAEAGAAVEQVKSQLAEARAAQQQLQQEWERASRLFEKESLTMPDYEASKARCEMGAAKCEAIKAQLAMTEARARGAQAQIEQAEIGKKDCELRAPMAGMLLARNVEIGTLSAPGATAFVVADISSVKAVFGVPDVAAASLQPGTALSVTSESTRGVAFHGRLTHISPVADAKTRVFDVEALLPNPRQQLKPGMVVSLQLARQLAGPQAPEPLTVAPLTSLFQLKDESAGYALFVVEAKSGQQVARLRRVRVGDTVGNLVVLLDGLTAGEQVVVSGATLIRDGEPVRVLP